MGLGTLGQSMNETLSSNAAPAPNGAVGAETVADQGKVAPWWHTIVFLVAMAGYGLLELRHPPSQAMRNGEQARIAMYALTIAFEFVLLGYVWFLGLRLQGKKLRDIIGGKWAKFDDVAMDFGIAFLFWMACLVILIAVQHLLHINASGIGRLKFLFPQSFVDGLLWVVLACSAGFCEEIVFRGYLQRQFQAATGNRWVAVVLQALVFGWVHVYQTMKNAVVITVYGALFGILAVLRGSLRPGMLQHAGQDTLAGIAGALLSKYKYI
jgi:uncharacterized protein